MFPVRVDVLPEWEQSLSGNGYLGGLRHLEQGTRSIWMIDLRLSVDRQFGAESRLSLDTAQEGTGLNTSHLSVCPSVSKLRLRLVQSHGDFEMGRHSR